MLRKERMRELTSLQSNDEAPYDISKVSEEDYMDAVLTHDSQSSGLAIQLCHLSFVKFLQALQIVTCLQEPNCAGDTADAELTKMVDQQHVKLAWVSVDEPYQTLQAS